jgi:hypothetical protein
MRLLAAPSLRLLAAACLWLAAALASPAAASEAVQAAAAALALVAWVAVAAALALVAASLVAALLAAAAADDAQRHCSCAAHAVCVCRACPLACTCAVLQLQHALVIQSAHQTDVPRSNSPPLLPELRCLRL